MAKPVRRTKEMLSANIDAPFILEELFNGIDFISKITREEFEEIGGAFPFCLCICLPLTQQTCKKHSNTLHSSQIHIVSATQVVLHATLPPQRSVNALTAWYCNHENHAPMGTLIWLYFCPEQVTRQRRRGFDRRRQLPC